MGFEYQKNELMKVCTGLISEGKVSTVIGFAPGAEGGNTAPLFMRKPEDVEAMAWDETCTPNIARYLPERREKTGIVAKPCDARAIVMYLIEKQIERDNVFIIGMECKGMKGKDGAPAPGCDSCTVRIPPVCDVLIRLEEAGNAHDGERVRGRPKEKHDLPDCPEDRMKRFQDEINKCILCYSCRQACYGCYCKTCFMDRNIPNWLPSEIDAGAKSVFHLGRAMHLAGRCVECGACERACPSGVKIRYLIQEINNFCRELYDYEAGMKPDEVPALAVFRQDDMEIGFLGGEGVDSCCCTKKQD